MGKALTRKHTFRASGVFKQRGNDDKLATTHGKPGQMAERAIHRQAGTDQPDRSNRMGGAGDLFFWPDVRISWGLI